MTMFVQGSFVSSGAAVNIPLPEGADYFVTFNQTQAAASQTTAVGVKFEWLGNPSFPAGAALESFKSDTTHAVGTTLISSGGFTYVTDYPAPAAAITGTTISQASSAVAAATNTFSNGDRVVLYGTTGMAQIGGMSFTVSSVSGSGFTLIGLNSSGFATAASAFKARKISPFNPVVPEFMYVTAVSQAAQAVVTVSVDPTSLVYVGQKLVFQIPSSFGMTQLNSENLNGIPAIVTAVNYAAYQFTINVNSSAFTAFAFPASTASPTAPLFATVAPQGSSTQYNPLLQTYTGYDINKAPFRSSQQFPLMSLAAGVNGPAGQTSDVIIWQAWKAPVTEYQANA